MYSTISSGSLSFLTSLLRDTLNVYGFNTRNKFVMWLKRKKKVKPNLHFYISLTTPLVSGAQARLKPDIQEVLTLSRKTTSNKSNVYMTADFVFLKTLKKE